MDDDRRRGPRPEPGPGWRGRWLLAVPAAALLWPDLYNRHDPQLLGIPFFYAYQLLVIVVAAVCMLLIPPPP